VRAHIGTVMTWCVQDEVNQEESEQNEVDRSKSDLIMCHKIIFRIVGVRNSNFFQFYTAKSIRGHPYKLFKEHNTSTAVRQNFFSQRIINVWNYLAHDIVDFTPLMSVKRTIELVYSS